jgi:hypothetical protein
MQYDFRQNFPQLDVSILGINASGHESGNSWFTSVVDLPWLQDVDSDGDRQSDVWTDWQVEYRDVIILDEENFPVGRFNLSTHDLRYFENYSALRQMLIDAASAASLPGGDYNGNGAVEQADLDLVLLNWGLPGTPGDWVNDLPEGNIDQAELDGVLLNWGSTAALGAFGTAGVPEPSAAVLAMLAGLLGLGAVRRP